MRTALRSIARLAVVSACAMYALTLPPAASAADQGPGTCGVCDYQAANYCGKNQENMNALCAATCPGTTTGFSCTRNDQACGPMFADGWKCM